MQAVPTKESLKRRFREVLKIWGVFKEARMTLMLVKHQLALF
jgi:hypothetical protein